MPAKRTCTTHTCPNLTDGGACPEHRAATYKAQDKARGSRQQRGYGASHDRWARYIRARDPICMLGPQRHPTEPRATQIADHIVPILDGGTWSFSNGQGICYSCHQWKTRAETDARRGAGPISSTSHQGTGGAPGKGFVQVSDLSQDRTVRA